VRYNPQRLGSDPVVQTFLDMASMTTPGGTESYCWRAIPGPRRVDNFGNLHVTVGDPMGTMFASHLDTACMESTNVWFDFSKKNFVRTNGRTLLGADDKAGAAIMCHMIRHRIPGHYVFHANEELGCLGSRDLAKCFISQFEDPGLVLPSIPERVISFDRRGYDSVVTHQMGERTCSDQFATALSAELGLGHRPDPTGSYTDSNEYQMVVPECTNVSVGYFNQHTNREEQNIEFLRDLADRCLSVAWDELPTVRQIDEFGWVEYEEQQQSPDELFEPAPGDSACEFDYHFEDNTFQDGDSF